jgi:hypothetical protein
MVWIVSRSLCCEMRREVSLVTSVDIPISWPSCVSPEGRLPDPGSNTELSAELVGTGREDLVCFSTVRWSASTRRARLVLARAAINRRVFYIEPPRSDTARSYIEVTGDASGVRIAIPHIPRAARSQEPWNLVRSFFRAGRVRKFVSCYYAASQLSFSASPDGVPHVAYQRRTFGTRSAWSLRGLLEERLRFIQGGGRSANRGEWASAEQRNRRLSVDNDRSFGRQGEQVETHDE